MFVLKRFCRTFSVLASRSLSSRRLLRMSDCSRNTPQYRGWTNSLHTTVQKAYLNNNHDDDIDK